MSINKWIVTAGIIFLLFIFLKAKASSRLPEGFNLADFPHQYNSTSLDESGDVTYNGTTYQNAPFKTVMGVKTTWINEINTYLWFNGSRWIKLM